MNKNKVFHIIASVLLVMLSNKLVDLSSNLYLGLRHPDIYLTLVIVGLIVNISIQIYGAYKILEILQTKFKDIK